MFLFIPFPCVFMCSPQPCDNCRKLIRKRGDGGKKESKLICNSAVERTCAKSVLGGNFGDFDAPYAQILPFKQQDL